MKRSQIEIVPEYFSRYTNLAPDKELDSILQHGGIELYINDLQKLTELGDHAYAEGKWSVKEIVEHLIDTERIFAARALRILRNDPTVMPPFDQDIFADNMRSNTKDLDALLAEYTMVRNSNCFLLGRLSDEELLRSGFVGDQEISILAIGFILIGHPIHHHNVIKERYYPLLD